MKVHHEMKFCFLQFLFRFHPFNFDDVIDVYVLCCFCFYVIFQIANKNFGYWVNGNTFLSVGDTSKLVIFRHFPDKNLFLCICFVIRNAARESHRPFSEKELKVDFA